MKSDEVIVKNSKIHGKGVFAGRDFKKGEVILHWDLSHTISKEKADKLSDKEKEYLCFFENRYIIMQE